MPKTDLTLNQISSLLDKKLKPVNLRLDNIEERLKFQGYTLEAHTASLVNIEDQVKILPDLRSYGIDHSEKLDDHEERIINLESTPKT